MKINGIVLVAVIALITHSGAFVLGRYTKKTVNVVNQCDTVTQKLLLYRDTCNVQKASKIKRSGHIPIKASVINPIITEWDTTINIHDTTFVMLPDSNYNPYVRNYSYTEPGITLTETIVGFGFIVDINRELKIEPSVFTDKVSKPIITPTVIKPAKPKGRMYAGVYGGGDFTILDDVLPHYGVSLSYEYKSAIVVNTQIALNRKNYTASVLLPLFKFY